MSDVDRASSAWGWPVLRMSQLGRRSVLGALTSLVAGVLCLWLEVPMTWPILVVGQGSSGLASVVDVRKRRLPDVVVIPATVAVVMLVVAGGAGEDAAAEVGVSTPVASRWFRHAGGMAPISLAEPSGRYLSFVEREEIALLRAQDHGVREIARRIGRDPATISRELRRNAATRAGRREYRAVVAPWQAQPAAKRPKQAKLATNPRLRAYVERKLAGEVTDADGRPIEGPNVPWDCQRLTVLRTTAFPRR